MDALLQNACKGKTASNGGLNVTDFKKRLISDLKITDQHEIETINQSNRKNLELLCQKLLPPKSQKSQKLQKSEKLEKLETTELSHICEKQKQTLSGDYWGSPPQCFNLDKKCVLQILDDLGISLDSFEISHLPLDEYVDQWKQKSTPLQKKTLIESYKEASGHIESLDNIAKVPFFRNILNIEGSKIDFIIASKLYPHSVEGGLSPEQILTLPFIYFTHTTYDIHVLELILPF
jgi:hypothetical protein